MRVGLVMHGLDRPLSGVTRVALELGRALKRVDSCEVVFLSTSHNSHHAAATETDGYYLPWCERVPGLMIFGGPLVAVAARRLGLDVVHDPVGVSPFTLGRWAGRFRRIVTIHDAIAFRYPEGYNWSNNFLHRRYVPATLRNVDGVITDSEDARADLERFLKIDSGRISVVPNGVGENFRPMAANEAAAVARRYGLVREYVLHVGVGQARKNVAGLLRAFKQIESRVPTHDLALVGPAGSITAELRDLAAALDLSERVNFLGPVPEADLPAIYAAASLFVMPSFFEGYGLPVLEAMACGTPVVCANTSSLPEVAGDAAVLVDPRNHEELGHAAWRVLSDTQLRTELREKGLRRAREYTWERTARETVSVYERHLSQLV